MSQRAINRKLFWIAGQIITCESKVSYQKLAAALCTARKFKKSTQPYRCPVCGDWHLTKGIRL